jgi:hypothetical protein
MKKPSVHRIFGDKRLRLTVITGHGSELLGHGGTKREAVSQIIRLRKEGYNARMVYSHTFGYLVYSNKPWHRIPW